MHFQERYSYAIVGVNSTYTEPQGSPTAIAGFLAVTAGTVTVTKSDGTVVVNAVPVTAGVYTPMPFHVGPRFTIMTAGGASGTAAVF